MTSTATIWAIACFKSLQKDWKRKSYHLIYYVGSAEMNSLFSSPMQKISKVYSYINRIYVALSKPFSIDEVALYVTASIGKSTIVKSKQANLREMIQQADKSFIWLSLEITTYNSEACMDFIPYRLFFYSPRKTIFHPSINRLIEFVTPLLRLVDWSKSYFFSLFFLYNYVLPLINETIYQFLRTLKKELTVRGIRMANVNDKVWPTAEWLEKRISLKTGLILIFGVPFLLLILMAFFTKLGVVLTGIYMLAVVAFFFILSNYLYLKKNPSILRFLFSKKMLQNVLLIGMIGLVFYLGRGEILDYPYYFAKDFETYVGVPEDITYVDEVGRRGKKLTYFWLVNGDRLHYWGIIEGLNPTHSYKVEYLPNSKEIVYLTDLVTKEHWELR